MLTVSQKPLPSPPRTTHDMIRATANFPTYALDDDTGHTTPQDAHLDPFANSSLVPPVLSRYPRSSCACPRRFIIPSARSRHRQCLRRLPFLPASSPHSKSWGLPLTHSLRPRAASHHAAAHSDPRRHSFCPPMCTHQAPPCCRLRRPPVVRAVPTPPHTPWPVVLLPCHCSCAA